MKEIKGPCGENDLHEFSKFIFSESYKPPEDTETAARKKAINTIEGLYPPDTHVDGLELLLLAICDKWRELPTNVLIKLAALNLEKDAR